MASDEAPGRPGAIDGKVHFGQTLADYASVGLLKMIADRRGLPPLPPPVEAQADMEAEPAVARVYHNLWIVECPVPDCGDASFAWRDEPFYMCPNCWNASIEGKWRPVQFPSKQQQRRIENVLRMRDVPGHMNWDKSETVDDLKRQNVEKGHRLPQGEAAPPQERAVRRTRRKREE
jgi:hypothetical protein